MKDKYIETIVLNHNELPATVNQETGEVKVKQKRKSNLPKGKIVFEPEGIFKKDYSKTWKWLKLQLSPFEFYVAFELALMAKANTNSLEPLNDDTTVNQLVDKFQISRNKVNPLFKKLFNLGVYGKFEVANRDVEFKKYWILNPYLTFSGRLIDSDIANLFKGTKIAIYFHSK